jgi:hypothetical protein
MKLLTAICRALVVQILSPSSLEFAWCTQRQCLPPYCGASSRQQAGSNTRGYFTIGRPRPVLATLRLLPGHQVHLPRTPSYLFRRGVARKYTFQVMHRFLSPSCLWHWARRVQMDFTIRLLLYDEARGQAALDLRSRPEAHILDSAYQAVPVAPPTAYEEYPSDTCCNIPSFSSPSHHAPASTNALLCDVRS